VFIRPAHTPLPARRHPGGAGGVQQQPVAPLEAGTDGEVAAQPRVRRGDRRRDLGITDLVGERRLHSDRLPLGSKRLGHSSIVLAIAVPVWSIYLVLALWWFGFRLLLTLFFGVLGFFRIFL
jgi:hypothetical protein